MFELSGTHFARGVFELRLEKPILKPVGWILKLGPVNGRVVALCFFLLAGLMAYSHRFTQLFLDMHWAAGPMEAQHMDNVGRYIVFSIGLAIYVSVFFFQQERMNLSFDRNEQELLVRHFPTFTRTNRIGFRDDTLPFDLIDAIEVFGPNREPKTEFGFVEIRTRAPQKRNRVLRFKLLTEDQLKIYPANLSKIIGKNAQGDWVDPDDFPPAAKNPAAPA